MGRFEFTKDLETGIKDIDDQHRRLFACAEAVFSLGEAPSDETVALRAARFLIAYVVYHFEAEEFAMVAMAYPDQKRHHDQHASLRNRVKTVRQLVEDVAPFRAVAAGLQVLLDEWIRHHVAHSDKAFARHCAGLHQNEKVVLPSPTALHRSGVLSASEYAHVRVVHAGHSKPLSSVEMRERMLRR